MVENVVVSTATKTDCIPHDTPWHLTTHTRHSSILLTSTIKHTHIHTPPVIIWPCQEKTNSFTWKMTREYPAISFCDLLQTLLSLPSSHSLVCSLVCVCMPGLAVRQTQLSSAYSFKDSIVIDSPAFHYSPSLDCVPAASNNKCTCSLFI